MKISKRQFSNRSAALGIGVALLTFPSNGMVRGALAFNQSPPISLFNTALRGVGPREKPVAISDGVPAKRSLCEASLSWNDSANLNSSLVLRNAGQPERRKL